MTARQTIEALREWGVDTTLISLSDLTAAPMMPRPCSACPRKVDVLVSTEGRRWVCLACAESITRAREQREAS